MKAIDLIVRLERALMKAPFSRIETQCLFALAAGLPTASDIARFYGFPQGTVTSALKRLYHSMLVARGDEAFEAFEAEWKLTITGRDTIAGFLSFLPVAGKEKRHG